MTDREEFERYKEQYQSASDEQPHQTRRRFAFRECRERALCRKLHAISTLKPKRGRFWME